MSAISKVWSAVLQSLICLWKKCEEKEVFGLFFLVFCQEHSAPFLWSSCELLAAFYAHHYLMSHERLLDCSSIFQRRSPMLSMIRTCYFRLSSIPFCFRNILFTALYVWVWLEVPLTEDRKENMPWNSHTDMLTQTFYWDM